MKFYIAAPMRFKKQYNFRAFDAARDRLLALGHEVISPADLDRAAGFDALTMVAEDDPCDKSPEGFDLSACIQRDVKAICDADAVCFIDQSYLDSTGARAEVAVAIWAGKETFLFEPWMERPVGVGHQVFISYALTGTYLEVQQNAAILRGGSKEGDRK